MVWQRTFFRNESLLVPISKTSLLIARRRINYSISAGMSNTVEDGVVAARYVLSISITC